MASDQLIRFAKWRMCVCVGSVVLVCDGGGQPSYTKEVILIVGLKKNMMKALSRMIY